MRSVHNWIGLIAGFVIALISLAGSVIVFRSEIRDAQLPKRAPGADTSIRASIDDVARQVARARPGAMIRRVRLPETPGGPYIVQIESGEKVERLVSDSSTAQVIGTLETKWLDWTVDLHRNLLSGKVGRNTVGAFGTTLLVLAATGLLLWIARARNWRAWITVPAGGSSRRFSFEFHRLTGLWSYAILTVVAFTGIAISYPDAFQLAMQRMMGDPAPVGAPHLASDSIPQMKSLDEYLRIARSAMPDGVPVELRLPLPGKGPVQLRLSRPGDLTPAANRVYLEPSTATVMLTSRAADRPLSARVFAAFAPIHYGEFGGFPIKALWALVGLTPSILFVTGLIVWWRPKKRDASLEPVREEVRPEDHALAGQR